MSIVIGIAGAARNAALALCDGHDVVAVCEQERLTRTRREGLRNGRLPAEALESVLRVAQRQEHDVDAYAVAEAAVQLPPGVKVERLDHHFGHAASAFYTSPFETATVLVCDRQGAPELSVWRGNGQTLERLEFEFTGPGVATIYSEATRALGFGIGGQEHRLEALARVAKPSGGATSGSVTFHDDHLEIPSSLLASVATLGRSNGDADLGRTAAAAADVQRRLGDGLLEILAAVKARFDGENLCLGGGLFFNSYFNTLLAQSGLYARTFVPVNPGNAGVSVGAAVAVSHCPVARMSGPLSPFLGPEFGAGEIKATLDNCKLSYEYVRDGALIERTASALANGQMVAWFQGRMEWGPRALGNRSILASPVAPYVLENLNVFLKQRDPYRSYSVSICADDLPRYFRGPQTSDYMEFEYEPTMPALLQRLLPLEARTIRVQTVHPSAGRFYDLIKAFGEVSGVPMVVNTSFNGFNEPIVCTPRDAVRVFYGTGIDMAAIGNFVLKK